MPRDNANGARAKSGGRTVPVGPELIRLYADYLHEEYGGIDSDHVFVNIWAEPKGHAWSYQAAYDLVLRLRARTGIVFDPALVPALGGDQVAARRRVHRGRLQAAGSLIGDHDVRGIWPSHGGGRAGGAGESRLADRAGGVLVTGGWITQADRDRWQRKAAAELAAILDAHPGLPLIAWTVDPSGGGLSGRIAGPVPGASRGPRSRHGSRPWAWKRFSRSPPRMAGTLFTCTPAVSAAASGQRHRDRLRRREDVW